MRPVRDSPVAFPPSPLHSSNANPACPFSMACRQGASSRPARGRIGGLAHHLAGRADHAFRLELGNRLAVLLPTPVDVATLVYGSRRPEELVQTLVEQRVLAVVLFGHLTGRRHPSQAGSALTVVLAGWHGFSRWQSLGCRMGHPKSFRMP